MDAHLQLTEIILLLPCLVDGYGMWKTQVWFDFNEKNILILADTYFFSPWVWVLNAITATWKEKDN